MPIEESAMKKMFVFLLYILCCNAVEAQVTPNIVKSVNFSQIYYQSAGVPEPMSEYCLAQFVYEPTPLTCYLNVFIRNREDVPVRMVTNMYLFNAANSAVPEEMLAIRFDLKRLGYMPGEAVPFLMCCLLTTFSPIVEDPILEPTSFVPYNVVPNKMNFVCQIDQVHPGFIPSLIGNPLADLAPVVVDSFNIGCDMPNMDLTTADGGINSCFAAATGNSMDWLKKHNQALGIPTSGLQTMRTLNNLMNKRGEQAPSISDAVRGKMDFIEMYGLPLTVEYQASEPDTTAPIKSTSGRTVGQKSNIPGRQNPDKDFIMKKGKANCDVELICGIPGTHQTHAVTLTGGIKLSNGNVYLKIKHDTDQDDHDSLRTSIGRPPGVIQEIVGISESETSTDLFLDRLTIPTDLNPATITNSKIEYVLAECPAAAPPKKKDNFTRFCQERIIVVPPHSYCDITFPDTMKGRNFNVDISFEYRPSPRAGRQNITRNRVWNNNGHSVKLFLNDAAVPAIVHVHNNDNSFVDSEKDKGVFDFEFEIIPKEGKKIYLDASTPSNEADYGGFSIGFGNGNSEEFGEIVADYYSFVASGECRFFEFPERAGAMGVRNLDLIYQIEQPNKYWQLLDFVFTVHKLLTPGQILLTIAGNDTPRIINIDSVGTYRIDSIFIAGHPGNVFTARIEALGGTDFMWDCLAFPVSNKFPAETTRVEEKDLFSDIRIGPNPCNERLEIVGLYTFGGQASIAIYDALGREVKEMRNVPITVPFSVNTLDLPVGMYILEISKSAQKKYFCFFVMK